MGAFSFAVFHPPTGRDAVYLLTELDENDYIDHPLDLDPGDDDPLDGANTRWWDAVSYRDYLILDSE
jgi:hypothetical protein